MIPKISIIVPVYNVELFLHKCIISILSQTFKDFELILINDGSTDKSGEICDVYSQKDSRIKVIHKKNEGQSSARNKGLEIARGDYIGFVDSDDWIEQDMYKTLYESSIKANADIAVIGFREVNEKGNVLSEYLPQNLLLGEILKKAYPWNKIFKRDLFFSNNLNFIEGRYYEDLELIPRLFVHSKKTIGLDSVGYNYLKRVGATTSARDSKILDNLWAYTNIKDYLIKMELYDTYQEEFEKGLLYFKEYYSNILYDYPTTFLLRNSNRIINDFNKIGGLGIREYISFTYRHLNFCIKRLGYKSLMKLKGTLNT
ncbi:glycosyltransferase family 2 protein [Halalkalibacter akibai]|uniref:Capsular polysaccharide biosynthesis protein n=1 Tax=Halalkalibacter akibai (strain ATCC 43226 / DSM 21942 / CIP 109018 / JCM 9157 / 1139) TaxID=1236973 RepID=W4QWC0_HALA3|nr:glycosyltransferase [Halalkalibacter akibai]GAE35933.1 capsular polysaccharide biosynthesis protein [Halalkalibacter akibai JCM 9157]